MLPHKDKQLKSLIYNDNVPILRAEVYSVKAPSSSTRIWGKPNSHSKLDLCKILVIAGDEPFQFLAKDLVKGCVLQCIMLSPATYLTRNHIVVP